MHPLIITLLLGLAAALVAFFFNRFFGRDLNDSFTVVDAISLPGGAHIKVCMTHDKKIYEAPKVFRLAHRTGNRLANTLEKNRAIPVLREQHNDGVFYVFYCDRLNRPQIECVGDDKFVSTEERLRAPRYALLVKHVYVQSNVPKPEPQAA